jgi:homospermidine synthase
MKNYALIPFTKTLMMLICFGALSSLPVQSQKISIDKTQLVELTKKAEKGTLYEDENTRLIVENYNLKVANKTLSSDLATIKTKAETYRSQRNKNRWALGGCLLAIVVSIVLRIKKLLL